MRRPEVLFMRQRHGEGHKQGQRHVQEQGQRNHVAHSRVKMSVSDVCWPAALECNSIIVRPAWYLSMSSIAHAVAMLTACASGCTGMLWNPWPSSVSLNLR